MQHVVDASVVAKWFLPEVLKDEAEKLLRDFLEEKVELTAPDILVAEIGNLLWKRSTLRKDISPIQAVQSYEHFLALGLHLHPSAGIAAAALKLAAEKRHPVYDMLYIALAEQKGCAFITADEKLANKMGGTFPFLRWLGDL